MTIDSVVPRLFEEFRREAWTGSEIIDLPDRFISIGMLPLAWWNQVHWVNWSDAEAERRIDEVFGLFAERGRPFVWCVSPSSTPTSLERRLVARGLHLDGEARMLIAPLPLEGLRTNQDLRVEHVTSEARMRDVVTVEHPDWDAAWREKFVAQRMKQYSLPGHYRVVGYFGDVPVATVGWRIYRDLKVVHFGGAETRTEYRGRGAYSTLVAYRVRHAMAQGCVRASILAESSTSAPILLKRGFLDYGRVPFYISDASQARFRRVSGPP